MTDQPALVSTSAAVAPAGPVPTTTASQSRGSGTPAHLVVGVAARLHVAFETDGAPTRAVAIAAVLGRAVRALARMDVQHTAKLALRVQAPILLVAVDLAEVGTERDDAVAVDLLPPPGGTVELSFRHPARTFDTRSPRKFLVRRERDKPRERGLAPEAAAERPARKDARRIECERTEQVVDVIGHAERRSAGMRIERWYEPIGRGGDHAGFVIGQKARHYGRERSSGTIFRRILASVARSRRLNARKFSGASYIRASTWLRI